MGEKAGGYVRNRRALGTLAVSRALGDGDLKRQVIGAIIADPEIQTVKLMQGDEFILIACDGLYDVMSSQEAVTFVRQHLFETSPKHFTLQKRMQTVCRALVNHAINVRFSSDNVSIVLVCFEHSSSGSQPKEHYASAQAQEQHHEQEQQPHTTTYQSKQQGQPKNTSAIARARDGVTTRVKTSRRQNGAPQVSGRRSKPGSAASKHRGGSAAGRGTGSVTAGGKGYVLSVGLENTNSNTRKNTNAKNIVESGKMVVKNRRGSSTFSFGQQLKSAQQQQGQAQLEQQQSIRSSSIVPNRVQKQRARTTRGHPATTQIPANYPAVKVNHSDTIDAKNAVMQAQEGKHRAMVESYKQRLRAAIRTPISPSVSLPSI